MRPKALHIGIFWLLAAASLLGGCRLPSREGPVPQSLANCRRLSQQGVSALEHGRTADAEAILAKAVETCPIDAEARRHYAESLWRRNAREEAIAQLEEVVRLLGDDATVHARLAEMYLATGRLELARQNADLAVNLDSKLPEAWAVHGGVMRAIGRPEDALVDYVRVLGQTPNDRNIQFSIAELYCELNRPEQAIQTLQILADSYTPGEEPSRILYLLGLAYVAAGRYDDGAESLATAVARGKPTPEMLYHLGEAQLLAGHPDAAAGAAQQALSLQPQHRQSYDLLQRIELAQQPRNILK